MLKTDLESKIAADVFNHFSLMSDVLQRKDGKLVQLDTDQEFLSLGKRLASQL